VFATLNGAPLEHSKKSFEGQQQRLDLLARYLPKHIDKLKRQVAITKKSKVAPDDLIDAFALMLCALHSDQLSAFPESVDKDPQGRTREIVYWQP
jgi:predicted RNase H-like nuclease